MKVLILSFLLAVVVIVECGHTFVGTNVQRPMIFHHNMEYASKLLRKRVQNLYFMMPTVPSDLPTVPSDLGINIQGIMAYDLTHSGASVNITQGGIGHNFVNLRFKSERGSKIHYDVYIYA